MAARVKAQGRKMKPKSKAKPKSRPKPRPNPLDDPNALTAPLTPRGLNEQVTAATNLYAAPAEAEVAGQRRVHDAMSQAIPAWYKSYIDARSAAMRQTGAAYQAAIGVQQNTAATGSALDEQQRATLMQQQQANAATYGANVDPALATMGQQAAASRRAGLDAQTGLTAGLGAADVGYRAGQVAVAAGQGLKSMEQEATRGRNIDREGARIAAQKGQFAVTQRQKLIDAEHTKQLENAAFGLDQQKAAADAQNDAASLSLREQDSDRRNKNERDRIAIAKGQLTVAQQRANSYDAKQQAAGKPKMSTAQRHLSISTRDDIEYTLRKIKQLQTAKMPVVDKDGKKVLNPDGSVKTKPANLSWGQIRSRLETGQGIGKAVPHDLVNAALDLNKLGYLSEANIRALHRRGVAVGALGYTTERAARRRSKSRPKADSGDILKNTRPVK